MEGNEQQQGDTQEQQKDNETLTFDSWYGALGDDAKGLLEDHVGGLKSALQTERAERAKLAKQIKELTGKADKGSELQTQLEKLTSDMGLADQRATFYEDAHANDVANLKLAWVAAQQFDLIGKDGRVDFDKLREQAPELFKKKTVPAGNAGTGANQTGTTRPTMNSFIRKAAGR